MCRMVASRPIQGAKRRTNGSPEKPCDLRPLIAGARLEDNVFSLGPENATMPPRRRAPRLTLRQRVGQPLRKKRAATFSRRNPDLSRLHRQRRPALLDGKPSKSGAIRCHGASRGRQRGRGVCRDRAIGSALGIS